MPATRGPAPPGAAPLAVVALLGRCPCCGRGPLFAGVLKVNDACPACGLDLREHDAGDGPVVAGVFIVGAALVIGALVLDAKYQPPYWVHALIWPLIAVPLTIWVMRVAKAALAGLQYRHRRDAAPE